MKITSLVSSSCHSTHRRFSVFYTDLEEPCQTANVLRRIGPHTMPIVWMLRTRWRAAASAVQAADVPTLLRRAAAAVSRRLGPSTASGRVSEPLRGVYGVTVNFHAQPSPRGSHRPQSPVRLRGPSPARPGPLAAPWRGISSAHPSGQGRCG